MKKLKVFTFLSIGALILILIIGKINANIQFKNQIKTLFGQVKNISNQKFEYAQILGLPAPVQRYFKHVLNEGQPYISSIRMKHDGQFKTGLDKDWINIKGEHYATANKPGFIWKGSTTMFNAKDSYLEDKGRLEVSIFSLIRIMDGEGIQYD